MPFPLTPLGIAAHLATANKLTLSVSLQVGWVWTRLPISAFTTSDSSSCQIAPISVRLT